MLKSLLCTLLCLFALAAPAGAVSTTIKVPLHEGRLRTSDLSCDLLKQLRLRPDLLALDIDLTGLRGALLVKAWNKALGDGCSVAIHDDALIVHVDTDKLPDDVDEAKHATRVFTEVATPGATAAQRASFGLLLPRVVDESRAMTVLVHGLDCNRANWWPMAGYLQAYDHQVAYFTYPSDQPLADSAALLRDQIAALRQLYPNLLINLLTHSMGALVAREYIEGDNYETGSIQRLIMIAPPNHGSKWAAARWGLELEEHYYLWRDNPDWSPTWAITDGLGEAGRDLKAKSAFLAELNARPRRAGVRYTIIAGNQHPAARMAGNVVSGTARIIPKRARHVWGFRHTYRGLREAGEELRESKARSDGPVTVKSTRLDGVKDHVVVHGDHTTIYIPASANEEPPAWAIVNDRLLR
ncbi:MAG TPA: alpha/beta fold hydrolase [Tepidisphaeraceae bacterium]|nr:alpha/beta fold hydrolase [Tepidisphaeraceae bacterium]